LKTSNLLFDTDGRVKVYGFNLPLSLDSQSLQDGKYMAPELILGDFSTKSSDIYSLGLIIWELITCTTVFDNFKSLDGDFYLFYFLELRKGVLAGERPLIYSDKLGAKEKEFFFSLFSDKLLTLDAKKQLSNLLCSMWNPDHLRRPSINIVINKLKEIMISLIEDHASQQIWTSLTSDADFFSVFFLLLAYF